MATHTQLPIYKVAYDLLDVVTSLVKNMQRDFTHSHHDRALLANVLRDRGHSIKADLTKTYRRSA